MSNPSHHHTAHELMYLKRRQEFVEKAEQVASENDPLEWERLQDEYADVCDGTTFLEKLKTRCGYATSSSASVPLQAGSSTT